MMKNINNKYQKGPNVCFIVNIKINNKIKINKIRIIIKIKNKLI